MQNTDIVQSALRMLGVLDATQTASAEDGALGLEQLNDLINDLIADGVDVGPPLSDLQDDFPGDDLMASQLKPLLALRLHDFYPAKELLPSIAARAQASHQRLLRDAVLVNMEQASMANIPLGEARRSRSRILTGD